MRPRDYSVTDQSTISTYNPWITDDHATSNHNGGGVPVPAGSAIIKDVYTNTLYTSRGKLYEVTQSNLYIGPFHNSNTLPFDINGNPTIGDLTYSNTSYRRFGFRGGSK